MPPKKKIKMDKDDLEAHKEEWGQAYTSQPLKDAVNEMNARYGSKITKSQAATYLKHQCKIIKNLPRADWLLIVPHVRMIEETGGEAEVLFRGTPFLCDKVQTAVKRYSRSIALSADPDTLPALPKHVIVRPLVHPKLPFTLPELPFHAFEKRFHELLQLPCTTHAEANESFVTTNEDLEMTKALRAIVPYESFQLTSSAGYGNSNGTEVVASSLYRSVICAVSNNFAGIESVPRTKILDYLRSQTNEKLLRGILSTRDLSTTRAIAANLFNAAIEADDGITLDLVLTNAFSNITANKRLNIDGITYTALERAAELGNGRAMKKLLAHGATVLPERAGLYSLITKGLKRQHRSIFLEHEGTDQYEPFLDQELLHMLRSAGTRCKVSDIQWLVEEASTWCDCTRPYQDMVSFLSEQWDLEMWTELNRSGVSLLLFREFDSPRLLRLLDIMIRNNADANYVVCGIDDPLKPATIIDTASLRGDLDVVTKMCEFGRKVTKDTLLFAMRSGNEALRLQVTKHYEGSAERVQFDYALRDIIRLMNQVMNRSGGSRKVKVDESVPPSLKAHLALLSTSETGDATLLETLLRAPNDFTPSLKGLVLTHAIRNRHRDVSFMLLANKADANVRIPSRYKPEEEPSMPPIYFALRWADVDLVRALLDADATLNYIRKDDRETFMEPAIVLAAESQNPELVKIVIEAGADVNPPTLGGRCSALALAAERTDQTMFRLLLYAGCEDDAIYDDDTVLFKAVQSEDVDMVKFCLDLGADPHNDAALVETSYMENVPMLDAILEKHYELYGETRPWGADVLWNTIFNRDFKTFEKLLRRGCSPSQIASMSSGWREDEVGKVVASMSPFGMAISKCEDTIVFDSTKDEASHGSATVVDRKTAFNVAIESNYKPIIELLLRNDADVNFAAKHGVKRTPIQQAAEAGNIDIVEMLYSKGANIHAPPAERGGGTALQLAALKGNIKVVRFLLEREVDVNAGASLVNGRTALEAAAEHGRLDVMELLLSAIAAAKSSDTGQFQRARASAAQSDSSHIVDMIDDFVSNNPRFSYNASVDQTRSDLQNIELQFCLSFERGIATRSTQRDPVPCSVRSAQSDHSDLDDLFDFDAMCHEDG